MNNRPAVFAKNITVSFDKTPALWEVGFSIPSGKSEEGLSFGIQFTAPYLREDILFSIGKDFEKLV